VAGSNTPQVNNSIITHPQPLDVPNNGSHRDSHSGKDGEEGSQHSRVFVDVVPGVAIWRILPNKNSGEVRNRPRRSAYEEVGRGSGRNLTGLGLAAVGEVVKQRARLGGRRTARRIAANICREGGRRGA
jgi:hypothetical protein